MKKEEKKAYGITNVSVELSIPELQCIAGQRDELVMTLNILKERMQGNENFIPMKTTIQGQINFLNRIIGEIKSPMGTYQDLFGEIKE